MGEVIHAPFGAEKGVIVRWDRAWTNYAIEVFGASPWCVIDGRHRLQFRDSCDEARSLADEMAKRYGLPLFDLTMKGRAA